jgi:hypothetical protein
MCAKVLLVALCSLGVPAPGPAAEVPVFLQMVAVAPDARAEPPFDEHWAIFLDGIIDSDAPGRLQRFIDRRDVGNAVVYFNSPGGSLVAAMAIGRMLRQQGFETHVGGRAADTGRVIRGVCYSACPFAFAGGARRKLDEGSVLGVHRAENRTPLSDETLFERRVRFESMGYLAEMGIHADLLDVMEAVPYDVIRPLSREEAVQFNLVN